jgi:hypothetical protein
LAHPIQGSLKGSGLLADAGIGMMVNIGNWQSLIPRKQRPALTATKPLQLRLDFPLFVNAVQAGEDYLAFRWVLGIARTF